MANKKISQLTEVTNPTSTDVIPVVNASETKKAQLGNLPISDATQSALDGKQDTLGYTAENVANRSTDVDADKTSLTKYPVVKAVYDWAVSLFATISQLNTKQDTLVSGTNIKTINSESLLGSGNIAIDLSPISVDGDKVSIAASSTATTQTTAVIQATDTNSGIAIVPNGTGAFTLDVPDGTATGGDARQDYAVDLQRVRANANQVVGTKYSAILSGANNRVRYTLGSTALFGWYNIIGGGIGNTIEGRQDAGTQGKNVIVGGENNKIDTRGGGEFIGGGKNNTIFGGGNFYDNVIVGGSSNTIAITQGHTNVIGGGKSNSISSKLSTISGGESNTASTNTHATVVGGYQNSSTGQYSMSGGYSNVASGQGAVALGYDNTASQSGSVALGRESVANLTNAVAIGYQVTSLYADGTTVKNFAISNYASLNFADDSAAATGGVPIGGVYHTSGALKIRLT